jgi:hypothetical protein
MISGSPAKSTGADRNSKGAEFSFIESRSRIEVGPCPPNSRKARRESYGFAQEGKAMLDRDRNQVSQFCQRLSVHIV